MEIKLPKNVDFLIKTLNNNGFDAYVVGGCVRDSLLGRKPKDWDIASSATPEQVIELFKNDFTIVPTGIKHGTVTIMIDKEGYEITTFRIDGTSTDNRHPDKVVFTKNIYEDLSRRDLSINALAYNPTEGIIDIFNGIRDLNNKTIRAVGIAEERFSEDALRILRAVRFSAQLGFSIEQKTLNGIIEIKENLQYISKERIRDEFLKIIKSDYRKLTLLSKLDLMKFIIPENKFSRMIGYNQNNPYHHLSLIEHTYSSMDAISTESVGDKYYLRLVMLLHDIGKPECKTVDDNGISHFKGHGKISADIAKDILLTLKFDKETINKVVTLINIHDTTINGSKTLKRLLNKYGEEITRDLLKVRWADIIAQNPIYSKNRLVKVIALEKLLNKIIKENQAFSIKDLKVNGKDLISIGYKPGKKLGKQLSDLLEAVIDGKIENTKELLLDEAKKGLNN